MRLFRARFIPSPFSTMLCAWMIACFLCACGKRENQPNVILIVADTLRSDRLGCYGYSRATSPMLDQFASGATLYEKSVSTASYTLPAHASMFTGQLPMTHMAQTYLNTDGFQFEPGELTHRELERKFLTLAEAFDDAGYRTAGFAANVIFLHPRTGLTQGFDDYFNKVLTGDRLNDEIFPWLEKFQKKPFFLFVNYMDTHKTYNTAKVEGFLEHASEAKAEGVPNFIYSNVLNKKPVSPELMQLQQDVYDLAIRNMDKNVGALIAKLKELNLYEDTLIIFTSDHGEFLGEHDYLTHWKDVYEEVVRVPFIVKHRGQTEGKREPEWISTVSIPRIILDDIGNPDMEEVRDEFLPIAEGAVLAESRYSHEKDYYSSEWGHRFKRSRIAVYEGRYKYIFGTDDVEELYDLEADPREQKNIAGEKSDVVAPLRAKLEDLIRQSPTPPTNVERSGPITEKKTMKNLKDLGYL